MNWLENEYVQWALVIVIIASVLFAFKRRQKKSKKSCNSECEGCMLAGSCENRHDESKQETESDK